MGEIDQGRFGAGTKVREGAVPGVHEQTRF